MKNKGSRPVHCKQLSDIAREWDVLVDVRHRQILEGIDLSYCLLLRPTVVQLLNDCSLTRLVDVGCGSGDLSATLAQHCDELLGIDISLRSTEVAASVCGHLQNTSFYAMSVEEFASRSTKPNFSIAVANMTLMTAPHLYEAVAAVAKVLEVGGTFLITITHPCFWPQYRGYERAEWFHYDREIAVEAPFRISNAETPHLTTHFHRPLSAYQRAFSSSGFVIERLVEPMPDAEAEAKYPEPWQFPRFLAFKCRLK